MHAAFAITITPVYGDKGQSQGLPVIANSRTLLNYYVETTSNNAEATLYLPTHISTGISTASFISSPSHIFKLSPSHHHTITPSHQHTNTPSHHHTITPSHQHTNTPPHHHTITPSHQHTITPTHQHTITQSHQHNITPPHHHTITPSHHHTITPSHHHTITPSHQHTTPQERQYHFWVYTDFYKWSLLQQNGKLALLLEVFADAKFDRRSPLILTRTQSYFYF
jgi:hypothetical protein